MSVLTRKRLLVTLFASLAVSTALFASNPAPRSQSRMAFDPSSGNTLMFGGLSPFDHATQMYHEIGETWIFGSTRWIQQFPAVSPSARAAHMMTTDTAGSRVILYGGRANRNDLNDTWAWRNGSWVEITTQNAPGGRHLAGMTFDRLRDRVVLFGGTRYSADKKTLENIYDTWEFDGTNWQQRAINGPEIIRPMIAFDAARNRTILVGLNNVNAVEMYAYEPAASTWTRLTPERMPVCVEEGSMAFMEHLGKIVLVGGACAITTDVAFVWDGAAWEALETETKIDQLYGQSMAYDLGRGHLIMHGGSIYGASPTAGTYVLAGGNWTFPSGATRPRPRSLAAFVSDPVSKSIWMYGGLEQHENGYIDDFWRYQNGQWTRLTSETDPTGCGMPLAVFDSDRNKVVLNCAGDRMWEWDVTTSTWAAFNSLSVKPSARRFAQMAYDPQLKKTVFFGGLESFAYKDDTWLWDGTSWSQIKKTKAGARALGTMWYDSNLRKVVLYGGIGRPRPEDAVVRYSDMWSFDTTKGWTKMTVSTTPGERYGALATVDPRSGKLILFGGLRIDQLEQTRRQVYADDFWEWNGSAWTRLSPTTIPPARENGMLAFDPSADALVMFGGFSGFYRSDIWTSRDLMTWQPVTDSLERRRVVRR